MKRDEGFALADERGKYSGGKEIVDRGEKAAEASQVNLNSNMEHLGRIY